MNIVHPFFEDGSKIGVGKCVFKTDVEYASVFILKNCFQILNNSCTGTDLCRGCLIDDGPGDFVFFLFQIFLIFLFFLVLFVLFLIFLFLLLILLKF